MLATVVATLIAVYFYFITASHEMQLDNSFIGLIMMIVGVMFFVIPPIVRAIAWIPLQTAEYKLTPHVVELYQKDRRLRIFQYMLLVFPIVSIALSIDFLYVGFIDKRILLTAWIILLGLSLDALHDTLKRAIKFFNPIHVASLFTKEAVKSIQDDEELELCHWIEALSEIAVRAVHRSNISLCNNIIDELQRIIRLFLESAKSIGHQEQDAQTKALGITDKISYTLFFLLQRIKLINEKAADQKIEPICSNIVTESGKIIVSSAKCDISLITHSSPFFGRFAVYSLSNGMKSIGILGSCTILEVIRIIINEVDLKYSELQEPFFNLINQLSEIARETFRQNKNINIKILTQPFYDLRELLKNEKIASHQDLPAILQQIDISVGEFEALEAVMRTIPPIEATGVPENYPS